MKKKLLSILLSAAMGAAMLAGCGGASDSASSAAASSAAEAASSAAEAASSTAEAASSAAEAASSAAAETTGEKGTVGLLMPAKSLERWNRDGSFLQQQFEGQGYNVKLIFSDNKIDQQIKDIEGLIAENVDLLVIVPVDGESVTRVLEDAKDAGIPVISYDRLIMNSDAVSYYVSFDNYTVGKMQGEFVRDQLDLDNAEGPFNIEFTAGDPADNNAGVFFRGAYDVLGPYIDEGKLVVQSGQTSFDQVATPTWATDKAMNRFQNILASNYSDGTQLDVALCSNDSTALGVTQAIESDYAGTNDIIITGQDGDEANLANIVDGKQTMTVYKAVANEAVVTLDLGVAILNGESPDEGLISSAGWDFDCVYDTESYDNGAGPVKSFLLTPSVVTKDNIQEELVDTGYYTMDDDGYPHPTS